MSTSASRRSGAVDKHASIPTGAIAVLVGGATSWKRTGLSAKVIICHYLYYIYVHTVYIRAEYIQYVCTHTEHVCVHNILYTLCMLSLLFILSEPKSSQDRSSYTIYAYYITGVAPCCWATSLVGITGLCRGEATHCESA